MQGVKARFDSRDYVKEGARSSIPHATVWRHESGTSTDTLKVEMFRVHYQAEPGQVLDCTTTSDRHTGFYNMSRFEGDRCVGPHAPQLLTVIY